MTATTTSVRPSIRPSIRTSNRTSNRISNRTSDDRTFPDGAARRQAGLVAAALLLAHLAALTAAALAF